MKLAPSGNVPSRPLYWEKCVLYAYLRMMGKTQIDAGHAVGRSERRVQEWEQQKVLYAEAREEARKRWLGELTDASRVALLNTIRDGHGVLALQILERVDEELAPAKQRVGLDLEGGGMAALLLAARENENGHARAIE